jgi:hypothetical protein
MKKQSSGMWHRVEVVLTDVLEERIASIFRVEGKIKSAREATNWPMYQPQMIGEGDCGAIDGLKIGRGNRSTRRKPAPATNRLSYGAAFLKLSKFIYLKPFCGETTC